MATKAQVNDFLNMIIPIAIRQAKKHDNKIYASVCIAQACHESGYGTSAKMVKANALFGIKVGKSAYHFGTAWKGASYNTKTKEYYNGSSTPTVIQDNFRAYSSLEDSTEDYYDMLCTCSRYKPALNQPNPDACIRAIVKGGYATGLAYADHIMKIINDYNLTQYDNGTVPTPTNPESYHVGTTYTTNVDLYVRLTPRGEKKLYSELSANAKKNGFADSEGYGILKKGTRVTCRALVKTNGQTWIQIPSGWICAINVKNQIYVE